MLLTPSLLLLRQLPLKDYGDFRIHYNLCFMRFMPKSFLWPLAFSDFMEYHGFMYVQIDKERRGLDNVQKVTISFDSGSKVIIQGEGILSVYSAPHSTITHTGSLDEWADAALGVGRNYRKIAKG